MSILATGGVGCLCHLILNHFLRLNEFIRIHQVFIDTKIGVKKEGIDGKLVLSDPSL